MKKADRQIVQDTVENEGFDYTFVHYSNFEEIKDEEFHRLRVAYMKAQRALAELCEIE